MGVFETGPGSLLVNLAAADFQMYKQLRAGRSKFEEAMKLFRKRKQPEEGGEGAEY